MITQSALQTFQEEMGKAMKDPYKVMLTGTQEVFETYRIHLIFCGDFISRKRAKVDFTKFSRFLISRMCVWASFSDVLNLIFVGFNFANGH